MLPCWALSVFEVPVLQQVVVGACRTKMAEVPFSVKVERTLVSPPTSLSWCPTMDLLAIVAGERQLGVHRLSWQRLFTIAAFEHNVTAIAWRPDGEPHLRDARVGGVP